MAQQRPLRYDAFARLAYVRPTIDAQKAPLWSCPECYKDGNHACRLACACGYRPGKSHEDKAWHAYRKAQAVPLPNPNRWAKPGPAGNAWERQRGAKAKGKEKAQEATSGEVAKMRAQIAKLERDCVPIERLRLAIEASQGISAEALLLEVSGNQGGGEKLPRKPPKHNVDAERRTSRAQKKVDKTTKTLADQAAELAKMQEAMRVTEAKLALETADLELAKQEQKQVCIDQLAVDNDSSLLCVAPPDLAGDEAFEQARKRFAAEVASIQEAKARANQNRGMQDVGAGPPLDSPPGGKPATILLQQPSSEADLLKAGLEPEMAKHTAEQLAELHRAAGGRGRSRSRSRG